MLEKIKTEFPELYTQKNKLRKTSPKRFQCECGNEFNKTQSVRYGGIGFSIPRCEECGKKAKETKAFIVWTRMIDNQIEEEDFILELVKMHKTIVKEEVQTKTKSVFKNSRGKALSHLVYFGYLQVDKEKRDINGIVEYSINDKKNSNNRYERIS
jgi:NAD-dependent SIR2 family protein deacetylase